MRQEKVGYGSKEVVDLISSIYSTSKETAQELKDLASQNWKYKHLDRHVSKTFSKIGTYAKKLTAALHSEVEESNNAITIVGFPESWKDLTQEDMQDVSLVLGHMVLLSADAGITCDMEPKIDASEFSLRGRVILEDTIALADMLGCDSVVTNGKEQLEKLDSVLQR